MKKQSLFLLKIALSFFAIYQIARLCNMATDGFSILNISSHQTLGDPIELSQEMRDDAKKILSQKFHYLACGGQSFAFVSEDGNYVLKFFKHNRYNLASFLNSLPLPEKLATRAQERQKRELHKLKSQFESYQMAFDELREDSGLMYLHLAPFKDLEQKITILDPIGISHTFDIDSKEYILQKKVEPLYPYISSFLEKNDLRGAKLAIDELLYVIVNRSKKGIYDEDARLHRNFGFHEGKGVILDAGRFKKMPDFKDSYYQDIYKITRRFKEWLDLSSPELSLYFEEQIEQLKHEQKNPV